MRALGLDVGSKTIGLALSDPGGLVASPWGVLERRGQQDDAARIADMVEAEAVRGVVVGWPLELDGRVGRRARAVQRFVTELESVLQRRAPGVPVVTWDERYSTAAAERTLLDADLSRRKRKSKIDAMAAQFILQGWLDAQPRAERVSEEASS